MRIYLDNAATSWPKPEAVYTAVDDYQRRLGAAAGRGAYREANDTERLIAATRLAIAQFIGADDPRRIIFTLNGSDSLNLAIHGLLKPGDHVVTTVCEHNSVLRPLAWEREQRGVDVTYVACDGQGFVDPDDIRAAVTAKTRLIAMVHASNVTGALQPAEAVGRIAAEAGVVFLLDAAQSLGHVPIDVKQTGCHLLAAPGHKGLLGPLGTGVLYIADGVETGLAPVRQGGTGSRSDDEHQPEDLPDRYESGNLNVPGIVGLGAGVADVAARGAAETAAHEQRLVRRFLDGAQSVAGLTLYGPADEQNRVGVVSFNLEGWDPQELATLLDTQWSLQLRAGLHCAPRMHASLGTSPQGCVRASFGPFNTEADVDTLTQALGEIVL